MDSIKKTKSQLNIRTALNMKYKGENKQLNRYKTL